MRKLQPSLLIVKNLCGSASNRPLATTLFIAVSLLGVMLLANYQTATNFFRVSAAPTTASKTQGCCSAVQPTLRRMIGTYYNVEDGMTSTLALNNKGPNQIVVTPILFNLEGKRFIGAPVAVAGESSHNLELGIVAAAAGPDFRQGSFEFLYEGRMMEMGGGLRIVDAEKSLIFDEQMLEPGMKFSSARLEAVYALPFASAQVSVIVSNTTDRVLTVKANKLFVDGNLHRPIFGRLAPRETRVFELPKAIADRAGAISLRHDGGQGALLAMIHVQAPDKGYSAAVNFTDPTQGKTSQYQGAGLRLGDANGDKLTPLIAVRNLSSSSTVITGRIPFTTTDGKERKIELRKTELAAGEIRLLEIPSRRLIAVDIATAGLELEYDGAPGSVIADALSVSASGDQVFTLPLKDPQGGMSSTGGYPWFINNSSSTVVFIKNVTDEPQDFHLDLVYPGGRWGSNLRRLAPHQTFVLDVRVARDSQEKGSEGNIIPLDATMGHVSWSVRGNRSKPLIGRAQTIDIRNGLASTYECQCLCPTDVGETRLTPTAVSGFPGDTQTFLPQQRDRNCLGSLGSWYDLPSSYVTFSSGNTSVAAIEASGHCTAIAPGSTYLRASWEIQTFDHYDVSLGCVFNSNITAPEAFCEVRPCAYPTNFRQTSANDIGGGVLRFTYAWDSSSGNLADLSNCVVGEIVTYPGANPFIWPSPPYASGSTTNNPTVIDIGAQNGQLMDTHSPHSFQRPYNYSSFDATQYYRYRCPCRNNGNYVNLVGPITINRTVQLVPMPNWTYTITKSGSSAVLTPLP